jgi:2',3'-cyclic-nucleotide 2'-phosphodiesterase (5'-nucleotidase family)
MTTQFKFLFSPITLLLFALSLAFAVPAARGACAEGNAPQLRVLFNSSVQAKLAHCGCKSNPMGGLARRAALIRQLSHDTNAFVLLDGGNLLPAAGSEDMAHAAFLAEATARLGYEAVGIGPHDLVRGVEALDDIATKSGLHFVSANLGSKHLAEFESYRILDRDGLRIAFTSVVAPELLDSVAAEDPAVSLARLLPELQERADLVVVACSLPPGQTIPLVEALDPATAPHLVIEAHGNTHPIRARRIGHTTVVAANSRGKYLGQIDFTQSDQGEWSAEYTQHALTLDLPEDPDVAAAVAVEDRSKLAPEAR